MQCALGFVDHEVCLGPQILIPALQMESNIEMAVIVYFACMCKDAPLHSIASKTCPSCRSEETSRFPRGLVHNLKFKCAWRASNISSRIATNGVFGQSHPPSDSGSGVSGIPRAQSLRTSTRKCDSLSEEDMADAQREYRKNLILCGSLAKASDTARKNTICTNGACIVC